jgi:transcriptional regulator GlxA family with amidase domain
MSQNKETTKVSILVLPESSMMTLSAIIDPLRAANRLARLPLFEWTLYSFSGDPIELTCGIKIAVDQPLSHCHSGDVICVVAGFNHQKHVPVSGGGSLRRAAALHDLVISVEAGTWILAEASIIKKNRVTTHWEDLENLSFAYPNLEVLGQRYVIDGRIWSSGGASPTLDMMLHYLRISQNRSLALDVASAFIYNENATASDAQAVISLGRIQQAEPRLAKAIRLMELSIEEPRRVADIAATINLSVRSLELLSKKYLGLSPGNYYRRLRLQAAKRLLLSDSISIVDISVRCGFSSSATFSRAFKNYYRDSPQTLRNSTRAE